MPLIMFVSSSFNTYVNLPKKKSSSTNNNKEEEEEINENFEMED